MVQIMSYGPWALVTGASSRLVPRTQLIRLNGRMLGQVAGALAERDAATQPARS